MTSTQDRRILNEMKAEMIKLYVRLGHYVRHRDVTNARIYERKIREMEKLFEDRSYRVYDCKCESDEDSDEAYEQYLRGKSHKCISCLRDFVEREKLRYPPLLDVLNWGLTGPLEALSSDESSGFTSSDEDAPKTSSYTTQKTLRKLRREGPDKFQLKYFSTGVEEFLKMEVAEDELKEMLATESAKDLLAKRERYKKVVVPQADSFDDFAGGLYKLSSDTRLMSKYSNSRFNFIATVVSDLQEHLRRHSKEHYPNVSEVIASSKSVFYKDREALSHYYSVLNKRTAKDWPSPVAAKRKTPSNDACEEKISYCVAYKEAYPTDTLNLPAEEVYGARTTGVLKLAGRSLEQVPALVWMLDKAPVEKWSKNRRLAAAEILPNPDPNCEPLTYLDLSDNSLTDIVPEGSCMKSLVTMKLAGNKISKLTSIFKKLTCLTNLDVANNEITKLPKALGRVQTLKTLNVSNNNLESVPDELGNLTDLVILDLRWNKLKVLPKSITELRRLKVLNVGYNRLRRIPTNTKNMAELAVLDVSYNKLSALPPLTGLADMFVFNASGNYIKLFPRLVGCKRLCEVRLDGNRIKVLAVDLLQNVPIVQLTLSYNKILRVPDDYYRLETLVLLDLTGNRLSWLPWSLARLKYLSCIKVELNSIKNVRTEDIKEGSKRIMEVLLRNLLHYEGDEEAAARPRREAEALFVNVESDDATTEAASKEEDCDAPSYLNINLVGKTAVPVSWLEEFAKCRASSLDLSRNKLGWLPYQVTMLATCLKQLFVRDNCFRSIPDFVNKLTNLTVLDVSGNHLSTFPETLAQCPIEKVACKYNEFSRIPKVLFTIPTITHLDFAYNDIKTIDVNGLKDLKNLTVLNLHANQIKHVPPALGFLTSIKELDIGENMFKYPEMTVLDKGTEEVMAYLRKHDESDVLYKYAEDDYVPKREKKHVTISKLPD